MTTKFRTVHSLTRHKRRRLMQTGLILRRKAGVQLPDQYLELAVKNNPKGWGVAVFDDGLQINHGEDPSVDLIKETIEEFDKKDITFFLCNSDAALNQEDISPFTIFEKDGNPELIAFITGKFPGREQAGSSHPAEFFIANSYLIPRLQSFHELTDGNIPKIVEQMKKPAFKDDLLGNAVDHCAVTFVTNTGESFSFEKGDTSKEYPWGWVSNHYGFQVEPAKAETTAKKSGMFGKSTVREKAPVPASGAVAVSASTVKPATSTAAPPAFQKVMWAPKKPMSRQEKKRAYKARLGYLPQGWEDFVEVEVYKDTQSNKLLTFSEVKQMGLAALSLPPANNPQKVKDTEVEHVPQPEVKPLTNNKSVEVNLIPIMSPATREHIKKLMADPKVQKLIDENADIIHDPRKVQQLEERFADFSTQLGLKTIDDFLSWSYEMMFNLCKDRPDGAAVLMWNFRNIIASQRAKSSKAEPAAPVVEEPIVETPPKKSGMFGQRKAG